MPNQRDKERKEKLAKKPTKSAFDVDKEQQARQKARDLRDKAVNNTRTRETINKDSTTHIPTLRRTRKDIEEELTQKK